MYSTYSYCFQVHADDIDGSSLFSTVAYRIQHGAEDKFVIDAETGDILVARGANLDPDRTQPRTTMYPLEVVALDGGIGDAQKTARTFVNISIVDVNNKPPIFVDPSIVRYEIYYHIFTIYIFLPIYFQILIS